MSINILPNKKYTKRKCTTQWILVRYNHYPGVSIYFLFEHLNVFYIYLQVYQFICSPFIGPLRPFSWYCFPTPLSTSFSISFSEGLLEINCFCLSENSFLFLSWKVVLLKIWFSMTVFFSNRTLMILFHIFCLKLVVMSQL